MIELFMEGQRLDVDKGFSTLITYAIDDIREPGERATSFSKTIILPGTLNNNKAFGNAFLGTSANGYNEARPNFGANYNAAKGAECIVFSDGMQIMKGVLRLLRVIEEKETFEYEVAVFGELSGFVNIVGAKKLTELDWSWQTDTYLKPWTWASVNQSWTNWQAAPGTGVIYPLIDYGTGSVNKHDWEFKPTFKPALYVYDYIRRIFRDAGYSINAPIFNTQRFKKLIVPNNKKVVGINTEILIDVNHLITGIPILDDTTPGPVYIFGTGRLGLFTPVAPFTGEYQYTSTRVQDIRIHVQLGIEWQSTAGIYVSLHHNGTEKQQILFTTDLNGSLPLISFTSLPFEIIQNDTIGIEVGFQSPPSASDYVTITQMNLSATSDNNQLVPINYGDNIVIRDIVPSGILQLEFLSSILKLFNLYMVENRFDEKLFHIAPYVDYYSSDSSNAVDWTYKVDRDKPLVFTPMSEMNARYYEFNYDVDSDYYSDEYRKRYNESYGSFIFDSEFQFSKSKQEVKLIFAGTPLVGYANEEKVYSTIFKRSNANEEQIDSKIRILQTKYIAEVNNYQVTNGVNTLANIGYYMYAGHLDDPDTPTNDLNFGVPRELFFNLQAGVLNVNQFNVYWSPYMAEVTDKDSKLLTCTVYLTKRDISELDFSKYVYIDGVAYRLKKITDYNASQPDTCKVELLKVINTEY